MGQFYALDLGRLKQLMRQPLVVDLRNIYAVSDMVAAGFSYRSVGLIHCHLVADVLSVQRR